MTAAHCVDFWIIGTLHTVIGRHQLSSSDGEVLPVSEIIIHPNWNPITTDSDIALLRLSSSYSTTHVAIDAPNYLPDVEATVIGWGQTDGTDSSSSSDVLM